MFKVFFTSRVASTVHLPGLRRRTGSTRVFGHSREAGRAVRVWKLIHLILQLSSRQMQPLWSQLIELICRCIHTEDISFICPFFPFIISLLFLFPFFHVTSCSFPFSLSTFHYFSFSGLSLLFHEHSQCTFPTMLHEFHVSIILFIFVSFCIDVMNGYERDGGMDCWAVEVAL